MGKSLLTGLTLTALLGTTSLVLAAPDSLSERLNAARHSGDYRTAIILLKNHLAEQEGDLAMRSALAEVYYRSGYLDLAQIEAKKVLAVDPHQAAARKVLLTSLLYTGDSAGAANQLEWLSAPADQAFARCAMAAAKAREGEGAAAQRLLAAVAANQTQQPECRYASAFQAFVLSDLVAAEQQAQQVLEVDPYHAPALILAAEIALRQQDAEAAMRYYAKLEQFQPNNPWTKSKRAQAQLLAGDAERAKKLLDEVLAANKNSFAANFLRASIAMRENAFEDALRYSESALNQRKSSQDALYIAAAASFALGKNDSALRYVSRLITLDPYFGKALKLQGWVYYQLADLPAAIKVLKRIPYGQLDPVDARLYTAVGVAAIGLGDNSDADTLLSIAKSLNADEPSIDVARSSLDIAKGNLDDAISTLENVELEQPAESLVSVSLIQNYLRNKQLAKAEAKVAQLKQTDPNGIASIAGDALVALYQEQFEAAAQTLDAGLERYPEHPVLASMRAAIHLQFNQFEQAKAIYSRQLAKDPKSLKSMLFLARTQVLTQDITGATDTLANAAKQYPDNRFIGVVLARLYYLAGDHEQVLQLAERYNLQSGSAAAELLSVKARAQLAMGDDAGALSTLQRLRQAAPDDLWASITLARLYEQRSEHKKALELLAPLKKKHPDDLSIRLHTALNNYHSGAYQAALADMRYIEQVSGGSAGLNRLLAAIHNAMGDYRAAIDRLEPTVTAQSNSVDVLALAVTYVAGGREQAAEQLLSDALAQRDDLVIRKLLAGLLIRKGAYERAKGLLEPALAAAVPDVELFNNLAWIYIQEGQTARAVELGAEAYRLDSDADNVVDTYALALIKAGKSDRALALLERRLNGAQQPVGLTLRKAQALMALKDTRQAEELLNQLLGGSSNLSASQRDEARALLNALKES